MTTATRWAIGLVIALIAGAIWMFWKPGDQPAPVKADVPKQPVAAAPAPAPVAVAPKVEEPMTASVFFEFDRSALQSAEAPKLDDLTARLKGRSFDRIDAVGYADRIGEEPYNTPLSRKRAEAVVAYLVSKGVDAARIRAEGKGESDATTGDACKDMGPDNGNNQKLVDCLQRDRRVVISFVGTR